MCVYLCSQFKTATQNICKTETKNVTSNFSKHFFKTFTNDSKIHFFKASIRWNETDDVKVFVTEGLYKHL